jgi:hypothetical protein
MRTFKRVRFAALTAGLVFAVAGFFCQPASAQQAASGPGASKIILISDNDDTLRIMGVKASQDFWRDPANKSIRFKSLAGMLPLYKALAENGVTIEYVSGNPNGASTQKFLSENHYPAGELVHRLDQSITVEEFKVQKITEIIKAAAAQDPKVKFILVGDNGEKDPVSYGKIKSNGELSKFVLRVYIHKLYSDRSGTALQEGQIAYVTPAEIAVDLSSEGLISDDQTQTIFKDVVDHPDLAMPKFGAVTADQARKIAELTDHLQNEKLKGLAKQLADLEKARTHSAVSCGGSLTEVPLH